ncbi:hypothetical protein [Butyrivibrio sp. AC2005]|uniref:hypothetical protein n=1 Tax=Butyrivibrio sp. AC2005 TaxID=1280672 RepID=UPI0004119AC3|nr:hypothetical protein [Butyrivibrio sp. AC2005]
MMNYKCKACKRIVYNPDNQNNCPFCGGTLLPEDNSGSMDAMGFDLQEYVTRTKNDFEQNHAKKISMVLLAAGFIVVIFIILFSHLITGIKKTFNTKSDYPITQSITPEESVSEITNDKDIPISSPVSKSSSTVPTVQDAITLIQEKLDEYNTAGDLKGAITYLRKEMDKNREIKDAFSIIYENYANPYREELFSRAEEEYTNGTWEDAVHLLEDEGYSVLGKEDMELSDKIKEYIGLKPQSLLALNPYKGFNLEFCSVTDVFGNNYPHTVCDEWGNYDIDNFYRLDGAYSKLEFTLIYDNDYKNMDCDTGIHIFADGTEIYTYVTNPDDRDPVNISVPLEYVNDLRIVIDRERGWGRQMCAADMVLYK